MALPPAPTNARLELLHRLIDHAPMFPPASLPLDEAIGEHVRVGRMPESWMIGHFVTPASRLPDLEGRVFSLAVVMDVPPGTARLRGDSRIQAVEGGPEHLEDWPGWHPYVEIPLDNRVEERLTDLRGARAKVRCGPEAPPLETLAVFIKSCRERGTAFKATAGLHHAIRTDGQHGLVNLLAAAAFGDEERALAEDDPKAFSLDEQAFVWRDRKVEAPALRELREKLITRVGSCSFTEPVEELHALGFL
ncbi:MAG TPA: hypothetical protein VF895_01530 [Gaiellaceae bacterium]